MIMREPRGALGMLLLLATLPACGTIGSEALVPSDEEVPGLISEAEAGDKNSVVKLVLYYGRSGQSHLEEKWFDRCLDLKIAFCFADRASELAGGIHEEKDSAKRESMKYEAIEYARKAISYETEDNNKMRDYIKMKREIERIEP